MKSCTGKVCLLGLIVLLLASALPQAAWCCEYERHDITFKSQGLDCAGWYYLPKNLKPEEKRPAIVMASGFSSVKEMGLDKFAKEFAEAGFVVLAFDYRYFGASEGEPRGQLFYFEQHQDYRNAITWVASQKEVDPQRIGIWGNSFSGGHVLHIAAFDKRVKAVVSQVPGLNQWETYYHNAKPELLAWFAQTRMENYTKNTTAYLPVVAPQRQPSCLPWQDAYEWFSEAAKTAPNWQNKVTVESLDINKEYASMAYIQLISPAPLLMIVASDDNVCPTEVQKIGFARAGEPKKMVIVEGGHFSVFQGRAFETAVTEAVEWFKQYLKP